jgi:hypothetical protein
MKVYEVQLSGRTFSVHLSRKNAEKTVQGLCAGHINDHVVVDSENFPPPVEETCWACGRVVVFPRQEAAWEAGCVDCGRHVCSECADDEGLCPCVRCDVCGSTDICCSDGYGGDWALCKEHCDCDHTLK